MRGGLALLAIAALIAAAVFLADHPGKVDILWQGWLVETSVGVLVAAALVVAAAAIALFRALAVVLGGPHAMVGWRRERRRRAGYRALTQGLVAVAAGDVGEAQRQARKADLLLADPPLTLLLSAQAAQLEGDESAAKRLFTAMLDRPETEFLGLRGLIGQALRDADTEAALRLAERARRLRPRTPWVVERLFELQVRQRRWQAARETLSEAERRRILPRERARHHRGVILYELSRAGGDKRHTLAQAARAQALTPDLATPAAYHARALFADGRARAARKAVERAWRTIPHPELAQVWGTILAAAPPLARVKAFARLAERNPDARESHLAVAAAALDAQLWGEARRHLERALALPATTGAAAGAAAPTPRLCLMMARLEEAEHAAAGRVRNWLDDAVGALPDPCYVCAGCGGESREWHSLCPNCGNFDSLAWRLPVRALAAAPPPLVAAADG